jgi:hypothetical protein
MAAASGTARPSNQSSILDMLIFAKANVDAQQTNTGITALMLASFIGCPVRVHMLLEAGGSTGLKDDQGDTAADWARRGAATAAELPEAIELPPPPPVVTPLDTAWVKGKQNHKVVHALLIRTPVTPLDPRPHDKEEL